MGSVFLYQGKKLVLILVGFSFSFSRFLFNLIVSPLFRFRSSGISLKNDFDGVGAISPEKLKEDSNSDHQSDVEVENNDVGNSVKGVEEKAEFSFTFKFPTYDEFTRIKKEKGDLFSSDFVYSDTSKCEKVVDLVGDSGGDVFCEGEENEYVKVFDGNLFKVSSDEEKIENSEPDDFTKETEKTVEKEHNFLGNQQSPSESEDFTKEIEETVEKELNFLGNQESPSKPGDLTEETEATVEKEHNFLGNQKLLFEQGDFTLVTEATIEKEHSILSDQESPSEPEDFTKETVEKEQNFLSNQESPAVPDHDEDQLGYQTEKEHNFLSNEESPVTDQDEDPLGYQIDSNCDGFLSLGDFVGESEYDVLNDESTHFDEKDSRNINPVETSNPFRPDFLSENDFHEDDQNAKIEDYDVDSENELPSKITDLKDSYNANKLESLFEHEELIQLLNMELRKARTFNLPTILEEEEEPVSPQIIQDFKPWKSDEKFHHQKCMEEIQKFYKSYTQRMKKFDIFNYQKMNTIGFLKLKDPLETISRQKSSNQMFKSNKVNKRDPLEDLIKEIHSDLEVVYVGQMCLSWELLRWQYGKALELWDYDPPGIHRYNEVAGEFQRFQVWIQRFVEDEPFQEPRVQYYIKSRYVNRNLIQVPLIREDSRNKRKGESSEYVITTTSDQLVEIIEESIRVLLRFIRADKETFNLITKGHKGSPMQLQNSDDFELLKEIRLVLQKKEKKLKEMRSGKFIFGRFGGRREEDSDQVLRSFYTEVDMKLVRRVLNMSKITSEQLLWCHNKLSRISVENRKLQVDPSFLPFPVNIS